jgi:hypothetical protein
MRGRLTTLVLVIALVFALLAVAPKLYSFRWPGNHQGYEPEQPIAFSHRLHAGELGIACTHCHTGAEKSKHAGLPAAGQCMNCHKFVKSPALAKLYEAEGFAEDGRPLPGKKKTPIEWVQVHKLPAFACFDHRAHVTAGVACQKCHGPVETMERVRQVGNLSMGWCVNCHREAEKTGIGGKKVRPSTDCAACHY